MDTHEQPTEKLLVGYRQLANYVTHELGCPYSYSTALKYGSPAINIGPPVEAYWGRLPAFRPSRVAAWAKARLKPTGAIWSPAATSGAGSAAPDDRGESASLLARAPSPLTPSPARRATAPRPRGGPRTRTKPVNVAEVPTK